MTLCALTALALLAYTYVGYPLVIGVLARLAPRRSGTPPAEGEPAALNALGAEAAGELLLLNDVRQPLSGGAVRALAHALEDPDVGCATGNLVLAGGAPSGVYWRYENWIRRQESRFRGVVGMSGAIAMVRRADLETLPEEVILDDVWIPARLDLRGKRVAFVA